MGELLFLILIGFLVYKFILKPLIVRPFKDGLNKKENPIKLRGTIPPEIAKEKGDKFEQYIVKKFNVDFFKIKEWRSDKYIDGLYAESNMNPDLEYEFTLKSFSTKFAVECKYRHGLFNGGIDLAKERQIQHYKKFEIERKMPVYIALGLGGNPDDPDELFLIPLKNLNANKISHKNLSRFRKDTNKQFFFDVKDRKLH